MATTSSRRRLWKVVVASAAVALVVTGCGKSVEVATQGAEAPAEAAASAPETAGESEAAAAPDAEAAPEAGAAEAPTAAKSEVAAPKTGAKADTAKTSASTTTSTTPSKTTVGAGKPTKDVAKVAAPKTTGTGAVGSKAAATGAAAAVEKLVSSRAIFGGNEACKPATLSEVNIGNVSTVSGVLGELFSPVVPALETWVASQNACGGLNGHKIKFFVDDDQGDPATAVSKVNNMIKNNKVIAFVGNIQVLTVDAIVPTMKRSGIPIIGGDITNNTWFTNPLFFPQGSGGQSVAAGYIDGALNYHKKKNVGNVYCIEVPRACEQINRAMKELSPELGASFKKDIQVSITSPSYVQQCLDLKNAGVEALAMTFDAASMNRLARSCTQVGYFPKTMPYPLGVGNEKQFLQGNKWLGDAYVSMNHFPWFSSNTPAEKYWQTSIKKFNPGFTSGGAASLGWTAGALLVAASANLPAENPTAKDLLSTLYSFKGQKFTELGGLSGPLVYNEGANPTIPYCTFAAIGNAENTGWAKAISKPICTKIIAPSDPQNRKS
ncbi:MAG: ABC transporter substrate-binding protein [Sporichthyaceae bacterium]